MKIFHIIGHVAAAIVALFILLIVSFMYGGFYRVTFLNTSTGCVGWLFLAASALYIAGRMLLQREHGKWRHAGVIFCLSPVLFAIFFFLFAEFWCPF